MRSRKKIRGMNDPVNFFCELLPRISLPLIIMIPHHEIDLPERLIRFMKSLVKNVIIFGLDSVGINEITEKNKSLASGIQHRLSDVHLAGRTVSHVTHDTETDFPGLLAGIRHG